MAKRSKKRSSEDVSKETKEELEEKVVSEESNDESESEESSNDSSNESGESNSESGSEESESESDDLEMDEEEIAAAFKEEMKDPGFAKMAKADYSSLVEDIENKTFTKTMDESEEEDAEEDIEEEETITSQDIADLVKKALGKNPPFRALKKLVSLFKISARQGTEEEMMMYMHADVQTEVILALTQQFSKIIKNYLSDAKGKLPKMSNGGFTNAPTWKKICPVVRSFLLEHYHLLDAKADPAITRTILLSFKQYAQYLVVFPKVASRLTRALTELWSGCSDDDVRLLAYICIRLISVDITPTIYNESLKKMYLALIRRTKFVKAGNFDRLVMLTNCFTDLSSVKLDSTYQFAFIYLRQLAIHLRNCLRKQEKEAFQDVYNWQFFYNLKIWTQVLCANPTALRALVFPLSELILTTITSRPLPRLFPIRLHCCQLLNDLSAAFDIVIPVIPHIAEILTSQLLQNKPRELGKPIEFATALRLADSQIRTKSCQDMLVEKSIEILLDHARVHARTMAFPEMSLQMCPPLRKISKGKDRDTRWRKQAREALREIVALSETVKKERTEVTFVPAETNIMNEFMSEERSKFLEERLQKQIEKMREESLQRAAEKEAREQEEAENREAPRKRRRISEDSDDEDSDDDSDDVGDFSDSDDEVKEDKKTKKSENKKANDGVEDDDEKIRAEVAELMAKGMNAELSEHESDFEADEVEDFEFSESD